jgi:uncharacterized membrane protein YedE/YeeE
MPTSAIGRLALFCGRGRTNMKAIFWTISILAGALFGLGSVVNQVAALF